MAASKNESLDNIIMAILHHPGRGQDGTSNGELRTVDLIIGMVGSDQSGCVASNVGSNSLPAKFAVSDGSRLLH